MNLSEFSEKMKQYGSVVYNLGYPHLRQGQSIVIAAGKIFGTKADGIVNDCFYNDGKINSYIEELYRRVGDKYKFPKDIPSVREKEYWNPVIVPSIEDLVKDFLMCGGLVTGVYYNGSNLEYELRGFAKSGNGILTKDEKGNVILKTRYDTVDEIKSFADIVDVSNRWTYDYRDQYNSDEWAENYLNRQ